MSWENRIVGEDECDPKSLNANPLNWRVHPDHQVAALNDVLDEVGWVQKILVNKNTGNIIDGHARVEQAIKTKQATVPVTYLELSENEERLVLATLDPISALAEQNDSLLQNVIDSIETQNDQLATWLESMRPETFGTEAGQIDDDAVPPTLPEAHSKLGDVWLCDEHKVVCADSRSVEYGAEQFDLIVTDPPYGLAYAGNVKQQIKEGVEARVKIHNDDLKSNELQEFLCRAIGNAYAAVNPGGSYYVFSPGGADLQFVFMKALDAANIRLMHGLIWVKDTFVLGRVDYHYRHESILFGFKEGGAHYFVDDRTQDSVWECPRPNVSEEHPTMKPLALYEKAITNSSRHGQKVLDCFLGSGTALIACEKTGRRCFGVELEPHYVDVAVRRWQQYTGKQAVHAETGEQFPIDETVS